MAAANNAFSLVTNVLQSPTQCFHWLQEKNLVSRQRDCPTCGNQMRLEVRGNNYFRYRCRKRNRQGSHDRLINPLDNTFFSNLKLSICKTVLFLYYFSIGQTSYEFLTKELKSTADDVMSRSTISNLLNYCREVCFCWIDRRFDDEPLLGGPGVVVEIDECKVGKRKYNLGRWRDGQWLLGMIEINAEANTQRRERRGGRYRLELCEENKRDAATLIPLIRKHVAPGTTIVTDCWRAYNILTEEGYHHFTVNHSTNFVDPMTGANTQTIESSWRALKKALKTGLRGDSLADHLCEYLYRREVKMSGVDPFDNFIEAIREVYPGL